MRTRLAIFLGKTISKTTRFLKIGGGSAAPGLYALKIHPELVEGLITKIPQNIVITGTNGKTTTARMLAHFAKASELKVIRNHTGSNLERGIASTLIQNFPKKFDLGIWELDEAAFNTVTSKLSPELVIFLNVSRDQLDRYGEVDKVVNNWCDTLSKLDPKTIVLVNGDDKNLAKLQNHFKGRVVKFGKKNIKNIKLNSLKGSEFQISDIKFQLSVPGLYHIYDAAAAIIGAKLINISAGSLKDFSPAFGRVEKLVLSDSEGSHTCYLFLIKNPAGATQVFETISPELKKNDRLFLALNDNLADGTDVSWIWDANFESIRNSSRAESRDLKIYVSGTRAYDLANRLKYAGFDTSKITVEPDLEKAFKLSKKNLSGRLFILPTYTAMLELQKILTSSGTKKHYWQEEN